MRRVTARVMSSVPPVPRLPASSRPGGMTLLELIVVLIIAALLLGMASAMSGKSVEHGRKRNAELNLAAINNAQRQYKLQAGQYYVPDSAANNTTAHIAAILGINIEDPYFEYAILNSTGGRYRAVARRTAGMCVNATMEIVSDNSTPVKNGCPVW